MSNLVIVALPEETDRVWKVSSEQVPHLTLLFLGEADNNPHVAQIVQFVQHAVELSEHGQFYLDVDYRGTLGDAEADVLYFSKRSWNLKWIKQFRGQLLQNQQIRTAYDSTEQHTAPQDWLPHLTLGYPDTPAKPLPDDGFEHPIYSVCFDRIAVWDTEFDGPEFRLEWPDRELEGDLAIAYSDQQKAALTHSGRLVTPADVAMDRGADFLEHYGKKGMKWGVRNEPVKGGGFGGNQALKAVLLGPAALLSPKFRKHTSSHTQAMVAIFGQYSIMSPKVHTDLIQATKKVKLEKANSEWEKGLKDGSAMVAVHNAASNHFNANIASVNAKHPGDFKKETKNFDDPSTWGPKYKSYMKDIDGLTKDSIKHAANELYLKNPSGTKEVEIHQGPSKQPGDYLLTVKSTHGDSDAGKAGSAGSGSANFGSGKTGSAGSGSSRFGHSAMEEVLQHAANPALDIKVNFTTDTDGRVTGFTFPDDESSMAQTAELGAEFLAHYGVKGMQWGVRNTSRSTSTPAGLLSRTPPKAVAPKATSKVPHGSRRKTKVETEGGENHPAHDDAIKVAKSKAKLKKSGASALSNQELQDVATRIRLEEQATVLTRSAGSKFIRRLLTNQGNQAANQFVKSEVDSRVFKKGK